MWLGRSLRGMGLAEAHYNRRGKALLQAHDIYSAPCEAFYHAPTGEAVNCNPPEKKKAKQLMI